MLNLRRKKDEKDSLDSIVSNAHRGPRTFAIAAGKSKMELKAGDEVYACNCGGHATATPCRGMPASVTAAKTWSRQK